MVVHREVAVKKPSGLCGDMTGGPRRGLGGHPGKGEEAWPAQACEHSSGARRDRSVTNGI